MKNAIHKLKKFTHHRQFLWICAVFFSAFIALYWDFTNKPKRTSVHAAESPETASTYIPDGYVLVPIEVANYESLDSILGKFGVVDLYLPSADGPGRPRKVAERVKILRAPLNPSHFAVLSPEADSGHLVSYGGPFIVVVQNPTRHGPRFESAPLDNSKTASAPKANSHKINRSRITVELKNADSN